MDLINTLAKTPLQWSLTHGTTQTTRTNTTVSRLLLSVVLSPGAEPIVMPFPVHTRLTAAEMLAVFLRKHAPENAAYKMWQVARGESAVVLQPGALDNLGERMHTGLRKLADSTVSSLNWHALHQIHRDDNFAIWRAAEGVLKTAFSSEQPVIRRELAMTLEQALREILDERDCRDAKDGSGQPIERTLLEAYALSVLIRGFKMTDVDEWTWGWLGYVVDDAPDALAPGVNQ